MITTLTICGYVLMGVITYCCFLREQIKRYIFFRIRLGIPRGRAIEEAISDLDVEDYAGCVAAAIFWPIVLPMYLLCKVFHRLHIHVLMPEVRKLLEDEFKEDDENSEAQNAEQATPDQTIQDL